VVNGIASNYILRSEVISYTITICISPSGMVWMKRGLVEELEVLGLYREDYLIRYWFFFSFIPNSNP